eukprot:g17565.t1
MSSNQSAAVPWWEEGADSEAEWNIITYCDDVVVLPATPTAGQSELVLPTRGTAVQAIATRRVNANGELVSRNAEVRWKIIAERLMQKQLRGVSLPRFETRKSRYQRLYASSASAEWAAHKYFIKLQLENDLQKMSERRSHKIRSFDIPSAFFKKPAGTHPENPAPLPMGPRHESVSTWDHWVTDVLRVYSATERWGYVVLKLFATQEKHADTVQGLENEVCWVRVKNMETSSWYATWKPAVFLFVDEKCGTIVVRVSGRIATFCGKDVKLE